MKDIVIGIDLGNTNVKCILINKEGDILGLYKMPSNLMSDSAFGTYLDSRKISGTIVKLCREAAKLISGYTIKGLAITSLGCAGIFLDENDRQIVFPDARVSADFPHGLENYMNTCGYPRGYNSAGMQLAWMMSENLEYSKKVRSFLSVVDYVNFFLTGVKKRELTTAGSMPFMDKINSTDWFEFLNICRIEKSVLPPVCQSGEFIGCLTADAAMACCLPEGTPVFAGGHDYLCGAFAAGCIREGDAVNVLGTFEMFATFFNSPQKDFYDSRVCSFMDFHIYPGSFTITAEHGCISFIKKMLADSKDMPLEQRFIQLDKDPKSQSVLANAIVSLNNQTAETLRYMRRVSGDKPIRSIKVIGGGSNSRFWLQNKANTLDMPVTALRIPEATALGAALLAGYGCGLYASHEEASHVFDNAESEQFEPM